jgi:selenide,water dikinase
LVHEKFSNAAVLPIAAVILIEVFRNNMESSKTQIRLTQSVKKGGCAAKLPAGELKRILSHLKIRRPSELILGMEHMDDASLWDLGDGRLMINTLDFFTPIVDDPADFGRIAAVNALSDIYAMGGAPALALTILAFPMSQLPIELLEPMMNGALEKIEEAGAGLGGGHSIDDETLKLGFSVTGFVDKSRAWTNSGAKPGDVLILTKGLGTGAIISAHKDNKADVSWVNSAIESMTKLNSLPLMLSDIDIHAATDVTGFGLFGHTLEMALGSQVRIELKSSQFPVLPGALECLRAGVRNRAHRTNREYVDRFLQADEGLPEELLLLGFDAQTSGGLLLAISENDLALVLDRVRGEFFQSQYIGRVTEIDGNIQSTLVVTA